MLQENEFAFRLAQKERQDIVQELLDLDFLNTNPKVIGEILKRYKAKMDEIKSLEE